MCLSFVQRQLKYLNKHLDNLFTSLKKMYKFIIFLSLFINCLSFKYDNKIINNKRCLNDSKSCSIPFCCKKNYKLFKNNCIPIKNNKSINFPNIYNSSLNINNDYNYLIRDPCYGNKKWRLDPDRNTNDQFKLLQNGSIYRYYNNELININNYCFGYISGNYYSVVLCFDGEKQNSNSENTIEIKNKFLTIGLLLSVVFFTLTFIVYLILPELNNIHGKTLSVYVGLLIISFSLLSIAQIISSNKISDEICLIFGTI